MTGREENLYTWIKFEFKPNKERSNIHGELQLPLKERKLLAIQHLIVSQNVNTLIYINRTTPVIWKSVITSWS